MEKSRNTLNLSGIKKKRAAEIESLSKSSLRIKSKKLIYLLKYGIPLRKFIGNAFLFSLQFPLGRIKALALGPSIRKKLFGEPEKLYLSLNIGNAGLGDAIIALGTVRDFFEAAGGNLLADVFYASPNALEFIALSQPGVRNLKGLSEYPAIHGFYDLNLRLNTFFIKENINSCGKDKIGNKFPAILKILKNIEKSRLGIEKYIQTRPFSEGILADIVVKSGHTRETYMDYCIGKERLGARAAKGNGIGISLDDSAVERFGLKNKQYITIHDGWDENTGTGSNISTKSYPPQKWEELTAKLKSNFPQYLIVQLGGTGNGNDIPGVDLNLRGRTNLKEAASLLADSSLHIDTDSGLVHIATSLGTRCAVLFGPTNPAYFSYASNITIFSNVCGNCWWSTDDWMSKCPRGLKTPECMASIEPADAAGIIKKYMDSCPQFTPETVA